MNESDQSVIERYEQAYSEYSRNFERQFGRNAMLWPTLPMSEVEFYKLATLQLELEIDAFELEGERKANQVQEASRRASEARILARSQRNKDIVAYAKARKVGGWVASHELVKDVWRRFNGVPGCPTTEKQYRTILQEAGVLRKRVKRKMQKT